MNTKTVRIPNSRETHEEWRRRDHADNLAAFRAIAARREADRREEQRITDLKRAETEARRHRESMEEKAAIRAALLARAATIERLTRATRTSDLR